MDERNDNHLPAVRNTVVAAPVTSPTAPHHTCANCGTVTAGNYCRNCGQRLDVHMNSVWHFTSEAAEVLTHADSSVWNTLLPLLTRPGFLTLEYFAGRRARYLQPFRLYLVLSVLFLLLASLLGEHVVKTPAIGSDTTVEVCDNLTVSNIHMAGATWLAPRLQAACRNAVADNGQALGERVAHNLGRAMFVFLPLLAAFMKLLYWRPRRYYLEHLLLLVHNHAFVFLWLSCYLLATHWVGSAGLQVLFNLAMVGYMARYLYRSMKVFYGQSGMLTFLKFNVLAFAYLACGLITLLVTTFYSAATM
jgi:hypothetical protein